MGHVHAAGNGTYVRLGDGARAWEVLRTAAATAAVTVVATGLMVLLGWWLDINALKSVLPGCVTMKPNTAVGFVLGGSALWLLRADAPGAQARVAGRACAALVALLGLLTVGEYLGNRAIGLDNFLFPEAPGAVETSAPGRMSPGTAVCFLFLGGALLLLSAGTLSAGWPAQMLVLPPLGIAFCGVIGYCYGAEPLYRVATYTAMALPTAAAFIVLIAGILCARPDGGWMAILTGETMGGTIARQILPVIAVALPALFWMQLAGERAGWFHTEVGVAMMLLATMLILSGVVCWSSTALNGTERTLRASEAAARVLNERLKTLQDAFARLAAAKTIEEIIEVAQSTARRLTGADGASFVLREGNRCFFAAEDAIAPLWKGQRFPMNACISGWVMLNQQSVVIEDICADPRIPADLYRPTFVKSLAMVPIRAAAPLGAIGTYWAKPHRPGPSQLYLLRLLADGVAVAMENVTSYHLLEERVRERTEDLEEANSELEAFSYSVSHDLRAPLRGIDGWSHALLEDYADTLDDRAREYLDRVRGETQRMGVLIDDLLGLSRVSQIEMRRECVDLGAMADEIVSGMQAHEPERDVAVVIAPGLHGTGDPRLLRQVIENLLNNAWKYTGKRAGAVIEFGSLGGGGNGGAQGSTTNPSGRPDAEPGRTFFVRDNGVGFEMARAGQLFAPFQRLHRPAEFPGTGVGLATVQRIIHRHGGRIWAEAEPSKGATFYFTLPERKES